MYVNKEYFSTGANSIIVVDFLGNETEGSGSFINICGKCSGDAADLPEEEEEKSYKMPTWELALIIVGGVVLLAVIITAIILIVLRCRRRKSAHLEHPLDIEDVE